MWGSRRLIAVAAIGATTLAGGCGALIPVNGPNALSVKSGTTWNGPPYGLIRLTPQTIQILEEYGPGTLSATFGDHRPPPEIKFGIGDMVGVSIFEAAAGGLFIPAEASVRPGNFITLPKSANRCKGNALGSLRRPSPGRRQDACAG